MPSALCMGYGIRFTWFLVLFRFLIDLQVVPI